MSKHYDYLVIGAGSGGIASANRAAQYGKKCLLIETSKIGGTCVNVGCVPKKVMWYSAQIADAILKYGPDYGFETELKKHHWSQLIHNRQAYIERIHASYQSGIEKNQIDYVHGFAHFINQNTVEVDGQLFTADHILIATGTEPSIPNIAGAEYGMDSNGFFDLKVQPKTVVIVGSGYIAVELAGVLNALGTKVKLLLRKDKPLRNLDSFLSETLLQCMQKEGIEVLTQVSPTNVEKTEHGVRISLNNQTQHDVETLIWAIGRQANTTNLHLENAKVEVNKNGYIKVDQFQNTSQKGIYAVGDITGNIALTPVAVAAGRKLSERLFNQKSDEYLDYRNVATVVFSHPPIGTVGLSEAQAKEIYGEENIAIFNSSFTSMYTAITQHRQPSKMKLVCLKPSLNILGIHGIGYGMDELLQGFAVALKMGATKFDLDQTIAIHPTAAEEFVTMH